ncbi:uncharacterized protein LOC132743028 [Ruditapes philippinarum]|uniref:uncharacterized protein LOC132743028 n=1 Tax=Ruditapes philippinarum TaxID=129788 RepID=UPI00295B4DA9|nr:uncharacterized protein LOC132743028 [Ruditapes philippinarum]XP_060587523.1 uncharacterized protein LOC132743028 [Ruditapes philippinarum]
MASKPLKPSTSTDNADGSDSKKKKCFTFTVKNQLRKPEFNKSVIMKIENEKSPLIEYMEKAVVDDEQKRLMEKFTVTYYSGKGYFIEAINDVRGTYLADKSYWLIRSDLKKTDKGISSFIPQDGTEVLLELITDGPDDKCE